MTARKREASTRGLVMPPGRSIPRQPSPRRKRPDPPPDEYELDPVVAKAAGELVALTAQIRACERCPRASADRTFGTGYARAPVMLVKGRPSDADEETSGAFADEAEPLTKAFEALGIPMAWVYGATAVRCGTGPVKRDEIEACSVHLLIEIEAVGPRVVVAFGADALESLRSLDGRAGIAVPEDVERGKAVPIRSDLVLLFTEDLPDGVTQKDAKRRLWADLRALPSLLDS